MTKVLMKKKEVLNLNVSFTVTYNLQRIGKGGNVFKNIYTCEKNRLRIEQIVVTWLK